MKSKPYLLAHSIPDERHDVVEGVKHPALKRKSNVVDDFGDALTQIEHDLFVERNTKRKKANACATVSSLVDATTLEGFTSGGGEYCSFDFPKPIVVKGLH